MLPGLFAMTALLASAAPSTSGASGVSASGAPTLANATADSSLLASLQHRYPAITRWQIRPFDPTAPAGEQNVTIVLLGQRSAVRVGKRLYWYAVSGFEPVVSVLHRVAAGGELDLHDGSVTERDVLAAQCDPLTDLSGLSGVRAKKALRADDIVCASAVEPRPAVARGDEVRVQFVGHAVALTTTGIAEKDGAVGDSLPVKNPRSREVFRAVVSGIKEVTIDE